MAQKIDYNVFTYEETNNPYSNDEKIIVDFVSNSRDERYFSFFINNADNDGVCIFLDVEQTKQLINNLNSKIKEIS